MLLNVVLLIDTFFSASTNTPTQDLQLVSTRSYNTESNDHLLQTTEKSAGIN